MPVNKLEPRVTNAGDKMMVGGLKIPVTSTLTALLYGFANHKKPEAKEYYFWRIADVLWNNEDLPEPLLERHPWADLMIKEAIANKYLAVGGSASSGKSHTMAAWGIVNWLSRPSETLVLMTSTTLREARKRIWGSVISLLSVIEGMPGKIRDSIGNIAYINEKGTLIEKAGLSLIAAEKSKTREAVGKFIGIKSKKIILIGDELSELSEAILNAGLSNLSKNPELQIIGMSNPSSRFDAFGVWSEPLLGWESMDILHADEWKTKWGGKYIRLDGERSPNILAGETKYIYLPTEEKLDEDRKLLGEESRAYMRMVRAVFFDSDENEGIYLESEISQSGAMNPASWVGTPVKVAGLDPAFTNGGDRTILFTGLVGYSTTGQFVFEFGKLFQLTDDSSNKAVPRTYQIVTQVMNICKKEGVSPDNLAVDSTGAGAPFCDVLSGEWSPQILRVSFGGKPSDKRVSSNSRLTGIDLYTNRVSELWFVGKELMRTGQISGIGNELAAEIVARNYEMVKSGSLKIKIESKPDFKTRFGRSPDIADAAFLALDCARQRHGLVAMDPPKEGSPFTMRPQRTIKAMSQSLVNNDSMLLKD